MVSKVNLSAIPVLLLALVASAACTGLGDSKQGTFQQVGPPPGESANSNVPGYWGGVVPWDFDNEAVVPVTIDPQPELSAGTGKITMSVAQIPFVEPDSDSAREVSDVGVGEDYYFAKGVAVSEVQGVTFAPTDSAPAYACYKITAPQDTPFTVGFAWYSLPESMHSYYVGIGDPEMQMWHWYLGPDDGVLTFNPDDWERPGDIESSALVCVVLESGKPADFWQLKFGVPEVRGTGLAFEQPQDEESSEHTASRIASSLPAATSLVGYLPPVANQGSMGACTAFACNDSGFNILLAKMYANDGWDVTDNAMRTSPMWSYVKSGIPPIGNWNPPCGSSQGRYMSQAFNVLKDIGSAVEQTVPYAATSNCSTEFDTQASIEADLLKIDSWIALTSNPAMIVDSIKSRLAVDEQPVVIAMYGLEYAFLNYTGGVYHYGGTYGVSGGHAMCVVGYDDSLGAFNVRNSWGLTWGDDGYWWLGYDAVEALVTEGSRMYFYTMSASESTQTVDYFLGDGLVEDEVEPNNQTGSASELPAFDFAIYTGSLGGGDTEDYLSFTCPTELATDFTLSYNGNAAAFGLELLDSQGNLLAEVSGGAGEEQISGYWFDAGTAYLRVVALSGEGSYNLSGSLRVPPLPPENVQASDGTGMSGILITWIPNESWNYKIERAEDPDGEWTRIGSTAGSQYTDSSVMYLKPHWYRIVSASFTGESYPSQPDQGYRGAPTPSGVTASDGEFEDHVLVGWNDIGSPATYYVKRSQFNNGPFSTLGSTEGLTYEDQSAEPGITYYYTVCIGYGGIDGKLADADTGFITGSPQDAAPAPDNGNNAVGNSGKSLGGGDSGNVRPINIGD